MCKPFSDTVSPPVVSNALSRLVSDCSLPGSSVHGILQARILEWVAITFSSRSSWLITLEPRSPALQADSLPSKPPRNWGEVQGRYKGNIWWAVCLQGDYSQVETEHKPQKGLFGFVVASSNLALSVSTVQPMCGGRGENRLLITEVISSSKTFYKFKCHSGNSTFRKLRSWHLGPSLHGK